MISSLEEKVFVLALNDFCTYMKKEIFQTLSISFFFFFVLLIDQNALTTLIYFVSYVEKRNEIMTMIVIT